LQKLYEVNVDFVAGLRDLQRAESEHWRWPKSGSPCCARGRSFERSSSL
jgi:hypothetical protein